MKKLWLKIKNSDFYKTYKEELIVVPILILVFYFFNYILITWFPNTATFDFFSELETIVSKIVLFVISLWVAHLALRISFPGIYKFLHEQVYHNFESISTDRKIDYAVKFILVFILASALVFSAKAGTPAEVRAKLVESINSQLYVREVRPNRGPMVDKYLKEVKAPLGSAWCGAFVGANLNWLDVKNPSSAYSPNYARTKDIIWKLKKINKVELLSGDVVTYYYSNLGRVGHVGFLEKIDNDGYFITIEGNTNGAGGREGDGVYKKKRSPSKVYTVSRYIK